MINISYQRASSAEQINIAATMKLEQGILLTEWVAPDNDSDASIWYTLYLLPKKGLCCVQSPLDPNVPCLRDLSEYFPVTNRLQRSIYDLTGIPTKDSLDNRPWLNHGNFSAGKLKPSNEYSFKKVAGQGVHEIAVGPVHAGIIEPGHFRFSVVGERVLKLEERFGYAHKGIHQLLKKSSLEQAAKIMGRISGDSTVGFAWAFAMACEHAAGFHADARILLQRGVLLERERIINHLNDIGAIVNDAGMPSLQASFHLLKEQCLRQNARYFQHRYLMDNLTPFSANMTLPIETIPTMLLELASLKTEVATLQEICDTQHGLQDRLQTTGILSTEQAQQLGVLGMTAKASGIDLDIRRLLHYPPYFPDSISICQTTAGDVAARVAVRFKEIFESIGLIQTLLCQLQDTTIEDTTLPYSDSVNANGIGFGCVEAWRGTVIVIVSLKNSVIDWCHFHDPSWQNWLAVEYAVMNNIVADFPLINKSFNLSYSGVDL